ncbi:hypothetical protein ACFYWN_43165 [Streptomyces sp. NPDC002917]|uniref:hypothetical protein n=1 Tax=Streptomyces sp. NPDC002917 TaxID=3364671 RepID=UPI003698D15A
MELRKQLAASAADDGPSSSTEFSTPLPGGRRGFHRPLLPDLLSEGREHARSSASGTASRTAVQTLLFEGFWFNFCGGGA